jgi:hypothetical protein
MSSKLNKTQRKRMVRSVSSKALKLYSQQFPPIMTMKEIDTINSIMNKVMKKIG